MVLYFLENLRKKSLAFFSHFFGDFIFKFEARRHAQNGKSAWSWRDLFCLFSKKVNGPNF